MFLDQLGMDVWLRQWTWCITWYALDTVVIAVRDKNAQFTNRIIYRIGKTLTGRLSVSREYRGFYDTEPMVLPALPLFSPSPTPRRQHHSLHKAVHIPRRVRGRLQLIYV